MRDGRTDRGWTRRLLARHGVEPTRVRLRVAEVMLARHQHLRAEEIVERLRQQPPPVSRASVYNTLALFVSKDLLSRVSVGSRTFYDSNNAPHSHFYNEQTGELFDFDNSNLQIQGLPKPPEGTQADRVNVMVRIRSL